MSGARPQPRYRLYTSPSGYLRFARDLLVSSDTATAVVEFERAVAKVCGSDHALAQPHGRVGIYVALKALIQPGQRVVLSPYTIADVINMVIAAGGIPVFADIEPDTCNIDPAEVERLIDAETGAVLVTHLHGLACPIESISALCRAKGVPLVEDAAQAFGARVSGRWVGSFGDVGVYSFGLYKNLTTIHGGMVVTSDAALAERMAEVMEPWPAESAAVLLARALQGAVNDVATFPALFKPFVFPVFRYAFLNDVRAINRFTETELDLERHDTLPESYARRMTVAQARLGMTQLAGVDDASAERIRFAERYCEGLSGLDGLGLPPLRDDGSHIYTYFPIQCEPRHALLRRLMELGRDVGAQHLKNCADLPAFAEYARDCPIARATAARLILLPTYPRYGQVDVDRTIAAVRDHFT